MFNYRKIKTHFLVKKIDFKKKPVFSLNQLLQFWESSNVLFRGPIGFIPSIPKELLFLNDLLRWIKDPERYLLDYIETKPCIVKAYCSEGLCKLGLTVENNTLDRIDNTLIRYRLHSFTGEMYLHDLINENNNVANTKDMLKIFNSTWTYFKENIISNDLSSIKAAYEMGTDIIIKRNKNSIAAYSYEMNNLPLTRLAMNYENDFSLPYLNGRSLYTIARERKDQQMLSAIARGVST